MRWVTGKEKYELVRRGEGDHEGYAIFAETSVSPHDGKTVRSLVVYVERHDVSGRPYWEEEIDHSTQASVLEWALLHPPRAALDPLEREIGHHDKPQP